jgi:hypothetical protein
MTENESTKRLQALAEHQAFLKNVLATAKKRVVIFSPFISSKAIKADNLSALVKQSVGRGVQVRIFIDYKLNTIDGEMKIYAKEGIADMVRSGARVFVADGIHNKTLICDNDLIAEGSFNWLSAVRIRNGECQREERTFVYTGTDAGEMIEQELKKIDSISYGEATIKLKNEHTEGDNRRGLIIGLCFVFAIPILIGKDIGDRIVGFICTSLMLAALAGLYWLRRKLDNSETIPKASEVDNVIPYNYLESHNKIMNNTPGGICTKPNAWGDLKGDTIGGYD